jgi:hypothetical protein
MKTIRELRVVALVALAAFVGACGSDSPAGPSRPADLGEVLTEMTLPSLSGVLALDLGIVPTTSAPGPAGCNYDASSRHFVCPTLSGDGITVTRSFALLDLSGNSQSQFDPKTTAAVHTSATTTGSIVDGGGTLVIDGQQELTLSGLLAGNHLLNGTSVISLHGADADGANPFDFSVSATYTNLALPSSPADRWPRSGSILVDLTETFADLVSTTHMQLTFNGTSKVAVVVITDGVTTRCTVDLASQEPSCIG